MLKRIISGTLPDGRLQLWSVDDDGDIRTRWKETSDPNAGWTGWTSFDGDARDIAVGLLPDGRLQLFLLANDGLIYSRWKETTDPDAGWIGWQSYSPDLVDTDGSVINDFKCVGVGKLPDGRLQVWVGKTKGDTWTRWKETTHPDAGWTTWVKF